MTQVSLFTDSSCYHAACAALLHAAEPHTDPFLVLGNNAATAAHLDADGLLRFSDPMGPLTATFARHGYALVRHPVNTEADWQDAVQALRDGRTIAIAADAFHLEHYWVGHGNSHALHVVVLRDHDAETDTVRLLDPGEAVFFDGRIATSSLWPAMCEEDLEQAWLELVPVPSPPDAGKRRADLRDLSRALSGDGERWLSGSDLVRALRTDLDAYLKLLGARPRDGADPGPDEQVGPLLLLGLWWYHHTLRWLAGHLGTLAADGSLPGRSDLIEAVDRASRDLLVVRNLLMRLGVMDPGSARAETFRGQLGPRLELAAQNLETAGSVLAAVAKEEK